MFAYHTQLVKQGAVERRIGKALEGENPLLLASTYAWGTLDGFDGRIAAMFIVAKDAAKQADDGNVYVDFDEYNYPTIQLTLKLVHQVPVPEGQIWLVGHAQDEKGRNIDDLNPKNITSREWRSQDSVGDMIKSFLCGEVGETVTFEFHGESNIGLLEEDKSKIEAGKNTTQAAAKKFVKFKLSLKD